MVGNKDLNRLKVVLVEKGGAAKLSSVSWREPEIQPLAIHNNMDVYALLSILNKTITK